jgi:hypothetical protein
MDHRFSGIPPRGNPSAAQALHNMVETALTQA